MADNKYTSLFKLLASSLNKQKTRTEEQYLDQTATKTSQENFKNVFMLLNKVAQEFDHSSIEHTATVTTNSKESLQNNTSLLTGSNLQNSIDDTNNKTIGFESMIQKPFVKDCKKKELFDQIKSLHCLFTWDLKPPKKQNIITCIKNKYGCNNLDLSSYSQTPEFTFVRFVGNLIISYELYKNGDLDASYKTVLDISNWLEKLDKGSDEFYLSINIGLKHIKVANFIHMLFVANENGGLKQLLNEIVPFNDMRNTSKAVVHAIRAIVLIEYGESLDDFKIACQFAKKSCELDTKTSYWFHIYSLVLMAKRQFISNYKIKYPAEKLHSIENEIQMAIQQAVMIFDEKHTRPINTLFSHFWTAKYPKKGYKMPVLKKNDNFKYNSENHLEEDMKIIVWKYRNGENPVLYMNDMIPKYDGCNRLKIMAQICSYNILFTNDLRTSVEQFLALIKDSEVLTSDFIINHYSSFIHSTETFNLAELICNEMKLATMNISNVKFEDILFYYYTFFMIEETCDLKIKVIDQSMKLMLVCNSLARCSNTNRNDLFDNNAGQSTLNKYVMPKIHKLKSNENDFVDFKQPNSLFGNKQLNDSDYVTPKNLTHFQTKTMQYAMSQIITTNAQQSNFYTNTYQEAYRYLNDNPDSFNHNFNSFKQFQCHPNLKLDVALQGTIHTSDIIKTNVTSDNMIIDTSLHKLPKSTSKSLYNACLKQVLKSYPHSSRIYTDASKLDNNVGIAIVCDKDEYCYRLSSEYTSSDAEAVAILRALDYALAEHFYDFVILSDSLSTIMCIQNLNTDSSDVIRSIVCLLHAHKLKGNIVQFIWVPGHNAIAGNEKADKLARQIALSKTAIIYTHNSFKIKNCK